jgi:hypothetical protein
VNVPFTQSTHLKSSESDAPTGKVIFLVPAPQLLHAFDPLGVVRPGLQFSQVDAPACLEYEFIGHGIQSSFPSKG